MNKIIKYLLGLAVGVVTLTSCETYGDPQYGMSSLGPVMSGYWVVSVTDQTNTLVSQVWTSSSDKEETGEEIFKNAEGEQTEMPFLVSKRLDMTTFGTADEDPTKMWVWINYAGYTFDPWFTVADEGQPGSVKHDGFEIPGFSIRAKVEANKQTLTFGPVVQTVTGGTVVITDGKITVNGFDTPTKHKADKIEFKFTTSNRPGMTFSVVGFRQTLWEGDNIY